MREPRRSAFGLLHVMGESATDPLPGVFTGSETAGLAAMVERGVRCPLTTSIGRLFDAVAALAGLRQHSTFEGQAAIELQWAAEAGEPAEPYPFPLADGEPATADWEPCVRAVLEDRRRGVAAKVIAARFHAALAELALAIARRAGLPRVALGGGCFQNALLTRLLTARLQENGFEVLVPQQVPPNDGGLAFGQAVVTLWRHELERLGDSTRKPQRRS